MQGKENKEAAVIPTQQEVREAIKALKFYKEFGLEDAKDALGKCEDALDTLFSLAEAYEKCGGFDSAISTLAYQCLGYGEAKQAAGNGDMGLTDKDNKVIGELVSNCKLALLKKVEGMEKVINNIIRDRSIKYGVVSGRDMVRAITKHIMGESK